VFIIDGLVWVHEHIPAEMKGPEPVGKESIAHALLGLDVRTGNIKRRIPTTDIFHIGHHHRCYRNKATTRYVFTARRGTETTDLVTGQLRLHPWVRSECRFGIIPANGLLYTAPHPCACYAGVSLTGYNALAATRDEGRRARDERDRLHRGPAYGEKLVPPPALTSPPSDDWPTHRQNVGRSGFIPCEIARDLRTEWRCRLDAPLSATTVSDGRVYVTEQDRNALVALDAEAGEVLWRFTAGGRIDSPPTLSHSRAVFGCRDGWVYCLSAAEGALIWRFRAAPSDLRMVADNRLESVWPVHGSVLVQEEEVVATAGRSSYLDGGLHAYRLDLVTGRVIEHKRISHAHLTQRQALESEATVYDHYCTDGTVSDLLWAHDDCVFLKAIPVFGDGVPDVPVLTAQSGFLDASAFERSFWYLVQPGRPLIGAQLIVHDADTAFGFRAYASPQRGGPWHVLGSGYTLFAAPCGSAGTSAGARRPGGRHVPAFISELSRALTWKQTVAVRARAMVLAENALLVAGSPDVVRPEGDPYAAVKGKLKGKLLVISREDGKPLAEHDLDAPPVWDGMAIAAGRVYTVMQNGTVACLGVGVNRKTRF
jgi:hypothetical protein